MEFHSHSHPLAARRSLLFEGGSSLLPQSHPPLPIPTSPVIVSIPNDPYEVTIQVVESPNVANVSHSAPHKGVVVAGSSSVGCQPSPLSRGYCSAHNHPPPYDFYSHDQQQPIVEIPPHCCQCMHCECTCPCSAPPPLGTTTTTFESADQMDPYYEVESWEALQRSHARAVHRLQHVERIYRYAPKSYVFPIHQARVPKSYPCYYDERGNAVSLYHVQLAAAHQYRKKVKPTAAATANSARNNDLRIVTCKYCGQRHYFTA